MNDIGPWKPGMYLYNKSGAGFINWTAYSVDNPGYVPLYGPGSPRLEPPAHCELPEPDDSLNELADRMIREGLAWGGLRWITRDEALALIAAARARHALENAP